MGALNSATLRSQVKSTLRCPSECCGVSLWPLGCPCYPCNLGCCGPCPPVLPLCPHSLSTRHRPSCIQDSFICFCGFRLKCASPEAQSPAAPAAPAAPPAPVPSTFPTAAPTTGPGPRMLCGHNSHRSSGFWWHGRQPERAQFGPPPC